MDVWPLDRARQERRMVLDAKCEGARRSHAVLLKLLLQQCPWKPGSNEICGSCDLKFDCGRGVTDSRTEH